MAAPSGDRTPERQLFDDLLRESREEVIRADTKASILFGLLGVALGVVLAGLIAGRWSPFDLRDSIEWLWWIGALFACVAMALLGSAIWPRLQHLEQKEAVAYFGHIAQFETPAAFRAAVEQRAVDDPDARSVDQAHVVSTIALRKYRLIQGAIVALGGTSVACLGAVFIDQLAR